MVLLLLTDWGYAARGAVLRLRIETGATRNDEADRLESSRPCHRPDLQHRSQPMYRDPALDSGATLQQRRANMNMNGTPSTRL